MSDTTRLGSIALLVTAILALGFLGLGDKSYWASHVESRRALIARNMVQTGDYMIPRANGKVTLTKPPLYYWSVAAAFKVFGKSDEGTSRIPSVIFGLGVLLLVYLLGSAVYDPYTGFWSAAILSTSYIFVHFFRLAELDMMFTFFITLSFLAMLPLTSEKPQAGQWRYIFWIAMALGFMVKGPFALMFPLGAYAALMILRRGGMDSVKRIFPPRGVALFVILVLPWFLYAFFFADGGTVFSEETLGRVASDRGKSHHPLFYIASLVNFSPWALLLPFALYRAFAQEMQRSAFFLFWFLAGIIVATLISAKNDHYILPLYPAAAIIVGRFVALHASGRAEGPELLDRATSAIGFFILLLTTVVFAALPFAPLFSRAIPLVHPLWNIILLIALIALCVGAYRDFMQNAREALWFKSLTSLFVLFIFMQYMALPELNSRNSHKTFLLEVKSKILPDTGLNMYRLDNFQVPFYLERTAPDIYSQGALRINHEKMKVDGRKYLIMAKLRDSVDVIKSVGGKVVMKDDHFVAVSKNKEGERFVLIEPDLERFIIEGESK